jgi:hypothetical protein
LYPNKWYKHSSLKKSKKGEKKNGERKKRGIFYRRTKHGASTYKKYPPGYSVTSVALRTMIKESTVVVVVVVVVVV